MAARSPAAVTLVFDGNCGFCTRTVGWVRWMDRHRRVTFLPSQAAGVRSRFGLTAQDTEKAAWAFDANGGRHRGAGAVNAVLAAALGTALPMLVYRLPLVRQLQDAAYALVARTRSRLPGVTPWCTARPDDCADRPG